MLSKWKNIYKYREGSVEDSQISDIYISDIHLILFAVFLLIIETTILNNFRIFNIAPDLLLISLIIIRMFFDKSTIWKFAFYGGLTMDLMAGRGVGIHLLYYFFVVFVILKFEGIIFKDNYFPSAVFIFFSTICYNIYIVGIHLLNWIRPNLFWELVHHSMIQAIYNLAIGFFMYELVYRSIHGKRDADM